MFFLAVQLHAEPGVAFSPAETVTTEAAIASDAEGFSFSLLPVSDLIWARMQGSTWFPGCPVGRADLRHLRLRYWDFNGQIAEGDLIVHADVAGDVVDIFSELYDAHYPIEQMVLIENYQGESRAPVARINTIAFNCRKKIGSQSYSEHSYGRAIDINPRFNPYVSRTRMIPTGHDVVAERSSHEPAVIQAESVIYAAFIQRGWQWGGDWNSPKDYMHFEKPDRQ